MERFALKLSNKTKNSFLGLLDPELQPPVNIIRLTATGVFKKASCEKGLNRGKRIQLYKYFKLKLMHV